MLESDAFGVKPEASVLRAAVELVSAYRAAQARRVGAVDTQLVCPAGLGTKKDFGLSVREFGADFVFCYRKFALVIIDHLSRPVVPVGDQRQGYRALACAGERALACGESGPVGLADLSCGELGFDGGFCACVSGKDDDSRGVHVQAVAGMDFAVSFLQPFKK